VLIFGSSLANKTVTYTKYHK